MVDIMNFIQLLNICLDHKEGFNKPDKKEQLSI